MVQLPCGRRGSAEKTGRAGPAALLDGFQHDARLDVMCSRSDRPRGMRFMRFERSTISRPLSSGAAARHAGVAALRHDRDLLGGAAASTTAATSSVLAGRTTASAAPR